MFIFTRIKNLEKQVAAQEKAIEKLTEKLLQRTTARIGNKNLDLWMVAYEVDVLKRMSELQGNQPAPESRERQ